MRAARASRRSGAARQGGLATVEFAIGSLVVLLLMLVAAELGRAYYSYHALEKAVRGGSRYLSTVALDGASVMDLNDAKLARTRALVIGGDPGGSGRPVLDGLAPGDIRIVPTGSGASRYVRVSATFDYRPMLDIVPGLGEDRDLAFTMNATSVMRVLR